MTIVLVVYLTSHLKKKKKEPGGFQIVLSSPFKEIKSLGGDE